MKHVWRVSRFALTARFALSAAGLILIAATPVILAAARVSSSWALAGATAAAALIVVLGGVAYDWHRGQQEPRQEQTFRVHDGCLVRADGDLPLVRDMTDPVRLGVHKVPAADDETGTARGGPAGQPAYIPRDLDTGLREQLAAGGFVLLVGDSTAGKTRMAFEAVRATLADHTLIAPAGADGVTAAVRQAADRRLCVLWLDNLERFLGPGGITAAQVRQLLGGGGHHRVIVATMRAAERARLTAETRDDHRNRRRGRDFWAIADQARQIRVDRQFSPAELERAGTRDWDPRIAAAIQHADGYGIAEYLAAGPSLLREWDDARSSSGGTHARAAAIVTAAVELRRAGYISPIPRVLLDEIHEHYLSDGEHASAPGEPLAEAWAWATARRSAVGGLLNPVGDDRVQVFDYLADSVQRRGDPLDFVIEPVIRSALASAAASDVDSLATTAYNQGRWPLAAQAWRLGYELLAKDPGAGHDDPGTLAFRAKLAEVLGDLGRLDEAEAESRAVLLARQRVLGPDHADTLAARDNLADVLRGRGRLYKAETEIRGVLSARRRVLGPDHPDTLAARDNLAEVLAARGRLDKAETEIRGVLSARRRVLGPDHPDTLASRGSLAGVLHGRGQLEEAAAEIRAVLAIRLRVLGPDHPDTLASRNSLASVLRDLGRLDEAEAEIRAVLAARQLVLGAGHPDSLASRSSLARVLRDLGWLDEAEAEIRAVLAIRLRTLGPAHPSTLATRNSLAGVLRVRGRLNEAEAEIRAVLAITLRTLGPDHPDTLASRSNLALVLRDLGRPDEAEPGQDAVPASRQRRGPGDASAGPGGQAGVAGDAGGDADAEMIHA